MLIASIGLCVVGIAKKRNRITSETYSLIGVVWLISVVVLSLSIGWSSYQMHQPVRDLENIKVRADALQNRVKAVKETQRQLSQFTDPQQAADTAALSKRRVDIRKETVSVSNESKALTEQLALVRSQFDELNQARMHREFILVLCVLVLTSTLILGAVYCRWHSQTARRGWRRIAAGAGIDPMLPSELVTQLAESGRRIEAIKLYREETGAGLAEAKAAIRRHCLERVGFFAQSV